MKAPTVLFALCAVVSCILADDTSPGVTLPALRSVPAGSVKASTASLVLRAGNIELTWDVTTSRTPGNAVTIQMPPFGWLGQSEPYPDRHFPELQIQVDGKNGAIESSFAAFVGSVNVTEAIRTAGVDPFAIADTPPFVTPKASALESLARLKAVERTGEEYLAKWTAQRMVKVTLQPGAATLLLTYKARPGYGLMRFDQLTKPAYLAKYCLAAPDIANAFGRSDSTRMFAVSHQEIPVSIDGKGPSSLSITADPPTKDPFLTAFCGVNGKPVIGQGPIPKSPARADAQAMVQILSIRTVLQPQSPAASAPSAFEVASIKASKLGGGVNGGCHGIDSTTGPNTRVPLGRCIITDGRLSHLVAMAYGLQAMSWLKGGPAWVSMGDDRFNIEARAEDATKATQQQLLQMLQSLLVERFQLKFHRENVDKPGFSLTVARKGPNLQPAKADESSIRLAGDRKPSPGQPISVTARKYSVKRLADFLSQMGQPVVDNTGLQGEYDFTLSWDETSGPSLSTALREQLGLQLESRKVPVAIFVVDSAQKPTEN